MEQQSSNVSNNIDSSQPVKKSKWKKRIGMILLILFNVLVIAYTAFNEFSGNESGAKFSDIEIRWIFLLPAALCAVGAILIETLKYMLIMKKTCGYVNFRLCLETVVFGRYYDNITPSGIGGQPYQIYNMKKYGVPAAQSAAIPLTGFVSMQYGFVLLALVSFIFGAKSMGSDVMRITGYFGLFLYSLFPTVILLFTFMPKVAVRVLSWGVNVLHKIHIVKDREKTIAKVENSVGEYVDCIKLILKTKGLAMETLLLGILYQIAICSIPFFVIYAFGGTANFFTCFFTTISIYAAITFIPTPGNMGAAEGSFYAVFNSISKGYVFYAMITWRFFTCYVFILAGLVVYFERSVTSRKSKAKEKKNENGLSDHS